MVQKKQNIKYWLVFSTPVPKSTIFWHPPQPYKDSRNILFHKKVQWCYFKGKCGNPDQPSVGAALTTATRGAGMWWLPLSTEEEPFPFTEQEPIYISLLRAIPRLKLEQKKRKKKEKTNQQTSTIMHYTARWSIFAVGAVSRQFPREQSSGKHTNPPLHKPDNVSILNLYKLTLWEVDISNKSKLKYLTASLKFTF